MVRVGRIWSRRRSRWPGGPGVRGEPRNSGRAAWLRSRRRCGLRGRGRRRTARRRGAEHVTTHHKASEHLHLGQRERTRAGELHAHVTTGPAHGDLRGSARLGRLLRGPDARRGQGLVQGVRQRRVRHDHVVVGEPLPAAVRTVPDRDLVDRLAGAEVDLPPRLGLGLGGVRDRAVPPHAVGVAVDGAVGCAVVRGRGLLGPACGRRCRGRRPPGRGRGRGRRRSARAWIPGCAAGACRSSSEPR